MAVGFELDPNTPREIVEALVETFDFSLPGRDQSLGRDVAVRIAAQIAERCAKGVDPEGKPWKPNAPGYASYKRVRYNVYQPGELGGQMTSLESLVGQPEISRDEITMKYGTGERPARASRSGTQLRESETTATDREKAQYFHDSGREFYGLTDEDAGSVTEMLVEALGKHFRDAGF